MSKKRILTGDRPTGRLHIGHYFGSLKNRVKMQESGEYDQYILVADVQALTDNFNNPEKVRKNVKELANIVQFGFGSILLVMGLCLIGFGLTTPTGSGKAIQDLPKPLESSTVPKVSQEAPAPEDKTGE